LAFGWFKRLQYLKRQKEAELNAAINDLAVLTQDFRDKSEMVENLRREMKALATQNQRSEYLEQLTHSVILTDDDWTHFKELFEKVHPGYLAEQKAQCPDLTRAELRLLALEKLGLDVHEIANILGISTNTVYQTRRRMRKKEGTLPSTSI
ncbi:MAG TPA: helix-turn-helix domain-containing protein, partial [Saprospiraceae bacterium]|nr:helix-turn-helix domain-containing protein [Saprospiraceae bacterium]